MENQIDTAERAFGDEQIEGGAQVEQAPIPAIERRAEAWSHDDVKRVIKGFAYLHSRNVAFSLACVVCKKGVQMEGRDDGGATLMGCACAVRRWV